MVRHFFCVVGGIYVVIGNIWERMKSVGISINIERKIIYEIKAMEIERKYQGIVW